MNADSLLASSSFLFIQYKTPVYSMVTHIQDGSSSRVKTFLEMSSQIDPECLLGGSKSSHVDSGDEPSDSLGGLNIVVLRTSPAQNSLTKITKSQV